jgi:hypothetical protein
VIQFVRSALFSHTAVNCYHRFDIRYTDTLLQLSAQQHQALLAKPNPSTLPPSSTSSTASAPVTNIIMTWFFDSGASTHVTPDINTLSYTQPYKGIDTIHIDNGASMFISHIRTTTIFTGFILIKLINVLHVLKFQRIC